MGCLIIAVVAFCLLLLSHVHEPYTWLLTNAEACILRIFIFFKTLVMGDNVNVADYVSHCDPNVEYFRG